MSNYVRRDQQNCPYCFRLLTDQDRQEIGWPAKLGKLASALNLPGKHGFTDLDALIQYDVTGRVLTWDWKHGGGLLNEGQRILHTAINRGQEWRSLGVISTHASARDFKEAGLIDGLEWLYDGDWVAR